MGEHGSVLVTGASRGLGRSVALALAGQGYVVFAGVRQRGDGDALVKAAPAGDLRPLILDVSNAESIAAAEIEVRRVTAGKGLAGLINNAARFLVGPFEQTPLAPIEELFRVNVLGVIAVTQHFLPLLRQGRGRVVNISSINGKLSVPFCSFYSASKFAVEALSDGLRAELQPWGIDVSVVQPGTTQTDIRALGAAAWRESHESLAHSERVLYEGPFAKLQSLISQADSGAADHHYVVDAVLDALTAHRPATRYLAGPDTPQWMEMASLPDRDRDAAFAQMFG